MNVSSLVEKATEAHINNKIQLAVFKLASNSTLYGINVSKVKSFVRMKDVKITQTLADNPIVIGLIPLNDEKEMYLLVNLDMWLGYEKVNNQEYKNIIYTEFNGSKIAFLVSEIKRIFEKESSDLKRSDFLENKITYITDIECSTDNDVLLEKKERLIKNKYSDSKNLTKLQKIKRNSLENDLVDLRKNKGKKNSELCLVIDIESLLFDISAKEQKKALDNFEVPDDIKPIRSVYVAEDSKVARKIIESILTKIKVSYRIFEDGEKMIRALNNSELSNIGLIITDLEMPNKDGYQVLQALNKMEGSEHIVKAVNTSMSNVGVKNKVESLGVDIFISKNEPDEILEAVKRSCI